MSPAPARRLAQRALAWGGGALAALLAGALAGLLALTLIAPSGAAPTAAARLALAALVAVPTALAVALALWAWRARAQRAALQARLAACQAERQARQQGSALRMLAHELKTPLTVIHMAADGLEMLLPDAPAGVPERVARISKAAHNLNTLVDKCLLLERVEGLPQPERRRRNLGELIDDAVADAREPERVHTDIATELWGEFDAFLLRVAVANLVDNALKYSPPGSTVYLSAHPVGDEADIRVRNASTTTDADTLARMFEPFWRSRHDTERPGVGLGLPLVRAIMQLHGGEVSASHDEAGWLTLALRVPNCRCRRTPRNHQARI